MRETLAVISVLMPVYNAEQYIKLAVESILNQTFTNFEFIIINDGSTDGTLGILEKYVLQDKRIRLVSRKNKGLVITLNEGIELAKAPLIARTDADDIALPHRFAVQLAYMNSHPDVVCLGARSRVIDEKGRFLILTDTQIGHKKLEKLALQGRSPITHPTAMVRTASVKQVGGYLLDNYPAEDLALWLNLCEIGVIDNLTDVLLEYRIHDNSISTKVHDEQLGKARSICELACKKRGVQFEYLAVAGRADATINSRFDINLKYGWWAYSSKQWRTSSFYAIKVIRIKPFKVGGWRLLFCTFFRRK